MPDLSILRAIRGKVHDAVVVSAAYSSPDPDNYLPGNQWYRGIGSNARRDLRPQEHSRRLNDALEALDLHPLANRFASLINDWVRPDKLKPKAKNERVDEDVQAFWSDPRNDFPACLPSFNRVKVAGGELHLPAYVNPADGSVRLDYFDPAEVTQVDFQPGSNRRVGAVHWKPVTGPTGQAWTGQSLVFPAIAPVMNHEGTPDMFGRLLGRDPREIDPATDDLFGIAGVLTFRWNCLPNSSRGRGAYFASLDYWVTLEDLHAAYAERSQFLSRIAGSVKVDGNDGTVNAMRDALRAEPKYASLLVHNNAVDPHLEVPNANASDAAEQERMIRVFGSAPTGFPPPVLSGDMTEGNRSVATSAMDPAYMHAQSFQDELAYVVRMACTYAIHSRMLIDPGRYKGLTEEDLEIEVETPSLLHKDPVETAPVLSQLVGALIPTLAEKVLDRTTVREVIVRSLADLGYGDISIDEVVERLAAEGSGAYGPETARSLAEIAQTDGQAPAPAAGDPTAQKDLAQAEQASVQQQRLLIDGAMDVAQAVAGGKLARSSGIALLLQLPGIDQAAAEAIIGPADFVPRTTAPDAAAVGA